MPVYSPNPSTYLFYTDDAGKVRRLGGWTEIEIARSVEAAASSFTFKGAWPSVGMGPATSKSTRGLLNDTGGVVTITFNSSSYFYPGSGWTIGTSARGFTFVNGATGAGGWNVRDKTGIEFNQCTIRRRSGGLLCKITSTLSNSAAATFNDCTFEGWYGQLNSSSASSIYMGSQSGYVSATVEGGTFDGGPCAIYANVEVVSPLLGLLQLRQPGFEQGLGDRPADPLVLRLDGIVEGALGGEPRQVHVQGGVDLVRGVVADLAGGHLLVVAAAAHVAGLTAVTVGLAAQSAGVQDVLGGLLVHVRAEASGLGGSFHGSERRGQVRGRP